MQQVTAIGARIPRLSRFGWLMGLYAENHARLQRLFAPARLGEGSYLSSIHDGLDVRLDVLERHPYTRELLAAIPTLGEPLLK